MWKKINLNKSVYIPNIRKCNTRNSLQHVNVTNINNIHVFTVCNVFTFNCLETKFEIIPIYKCFNCSKTASYPAKINTNYYSIGNVCPRVSYQNANQILEAKVLVSNKLHFSHSNNNLSFFKVNQIRGIYQWMLMILFHCISTNSQSFSVTHVTHVKGL